MILLVGVASFGLGRLSVLDSDDNSATVVKSTALQQLEPLESDISTENGVQTPVVASRSGSKYHLFDCPGAKQMKAENRIEFGSVDEARAAGYSPAANCPGI